jgi:hypothetical protein
MRFPSRKPNYPAFTLDEVQQILNARDSLNQIGLELMRLSNVIDRDASLQAASEYCLQATMAATQWLRCDRTTKHLTSK